MIPRKEPREVAYLAGAGISVSEPSGLPPASPFITTLVHEITSEPRLRELILGRVFTSKNDKRFTGDFLRFEALMGAMQFVLDEDIKVLRVYSDCVTPNAFHFHLAEQLQAGAVVMTTNFDNLIELACQKRGIPYSLLVNSEELAAFAANPEGFRNPIVKLHGGYDVVHCGKECPLGPVNLKATLEQVGKVYLNNGIDEVTSVLSSAVPRRHLIVMGYSGCDDFDIMPCLLKTRPEQGFTWIHHARQVPQITREVTSECPDLPPYHLLRTHGSGCSSAAVIRGVTAEVLGIDLNTVCSDCRYDWNGILKAWSKEHLSSEAQKQLLLGQILNQIGPFEESVRILESISCKALNPRQKSIRRFLLSNLYVHLGDNKQAICHLAEMADCDENFEEFSIKGYAYYCLARVNTNMGAYPQAEMYLNAAIKIFQAAKDPIRLNDCFHELGRICKGKGDYASAVRYFGDANKLSDDAGHLTGTGIGLLGIGDTLTQQGKFGEAKPVILKAIALFELNGDQEGLGQAHHALGCLLIKTEDYAGATRSFEQAIEFETSAGAKLDLGHSLHCLGDALGMLGDYEKSKECLRKSLKIKREINDRVGIANSERILRIIEYKETMGL